MSKILANGGRNPHYPPSSENPRCCNFVLQLRWSIFKTNNLMKEKVYPRSVRMMELQRSNFFSIRASQHSKSLWVYFRSSQLNWEICGNYFYTSEGKGETCYNLVRASLAHTFPSLKISLIFILKERVGLKSRIKE